MCCSDTEIGRECVDKTMFILLHVRYIVLFCVHKYHGHRWYHNFFMFRDTMF